MDEIDKHLVQVVEQDARQSSGEIAKQLNVSSATVRRRLKRLIETNELHVVAVADPVKSGFAISALTGLNIDHDLHDKVMDTLRKLPEVSWASTTTGRFDSFIFARYHSNEHLYEFLKNVLTKIHGIKDSETFVCLHAEKGWLLY